MTLQLFRHKQRETTSRRISLMYLLSYTLQDDWDGARVQGNAPGNDAAAPNAPSAPSTSNEAGGSKGPGRANASSEAPPNLLNDVESGATGSQRMDSNERPTDVQPSLAADVSDVGMSLATAPGAGVTSASSDDPTNPRTSPHESHAQPPLPAGYSGGGLQRRGSSLGLPPITTTTDNGPSSGDGGGTVGAEAEGSGGAGRDNQRFSLLSAVLGSADGGGGAGGNDSKNRPQSQHESRESDGSGRDSDTSDISRSVPVLESDLKVTWRHPKCSSSHKWHSPGRASTTKVNALHPSTCGRTSSPSRQGRRAAADRRCQCFSTDRSAHRRPTPPWSVWGIMGTTLKLKQSWTWARMSHLRRVQQG